MITRTIHCDVCGASLQEEVENAGFPGWGQLSGVALDGKSNPFMCPRCLADVADFTDRLKEKRNGVD